MNAEHDKIVAEARLIVNKMRHDGADHIADTIDALLKLLDEGRQSSRIILCPKCGAFRFTGTLMAGESDMDFKCAGCGHVWREPVDLLAPPAEQRTMPNDYTQPARAGDSGKEMG